MAKITLKGNSIHTNGDLPPIGAQAPDFQLTDADLKDHSLEDVRGKPTLIYIVPSLDTPLCSTSTKKFNEQIKSHPEVAVLVVSCDLPFAQKRMCSQEQIANVKTLSMMRSKEFGKAYGVLIQEGPLKGICARAVIVIDENHRVIYTELVPEVTQEPNYDKALKALLKNSS